MDYSKIFLKNAAPTSIGGQAVMEGVMMRGIDRTAMAMRLPTGEIYLKTVKNEPPGSASRIPLVRGVVSFAKSLVIGMKTLTDSADVLGMYAADDADDKKVKDGGGWFVRRFGEEAAWNIAIIASVIIAFATAIGVFAILPTVIANLLPSFTSGALGRGAGGSILLNLIEGVIRVIFFVLYIAAISKMEDIRRLFQYHGAEHKTIHTFENGLDLEPENAHQFPTLHPRCGTSFIMFVFVVSLLLFSLLGWPDLAMRIFSRIILIPVIAGISYELLKWAGRSDNAVIRILSTPGLMLQKLTTREPDDAQLEIAMVSLKAVLVDQSEPEVEAIVDNKLNIIKKVAYALRGRKAEEGEQEKLNIEAEVSEAEREEGGGTKESTLTAPNPRSVAGVIAGGVAALEKAGKDNAKYDATEIFCYAMSYSHNEIITKAKETVFADDIKEYNRLIDLRASGMPLQRITKVQEFMGLPIKVAKNVLIPRLDTEVLVDQVIGLISGKKMIKPKIADVGTGSGAIGVALADAVKDSEITMTDISGAAISEATDNARMNGVFSRCMFFTGDMFRALPEGKKFDIIVCNPPYIPTAVIRTLEPEVRDYEPALALNGGSDGLDFYRIIANEAGRHLRSEGMLALEIGSDQGESVRNLIEGSGDYERIAVVKDLAGLDRVVLAERK